MPNYPSTTSYPSTTLYPSGDTYPDIYPNSYDYLYPVYYPVTYDSSIFTPPVIIDDTTYGLRWNLIEDRQIETGIDRGVLYSKTSIAVAWNGLTSVDEEGGDTAVEYFIDGRPYLYVPKPKEFKAAIKAFTYPDAFSEIIGELEVADGMYLDSQMGDSFGLCYRTKIIDANQGENAGYKIHLIYNASVVPSAKTYGTIGNDINPVEFSWDISTVPIAVEGYRPTSHIIIDSRHMDPTRLNNLETLLYGTELPPASMPTPQTIFDLLSFGGTIIITDNGNGTWTAEGSYENVYLIADDIFQIDNVNAVNNVDGTYSISSTP